MQYAIVSASTTQELAEQVNQRLLRGWTLYSNPFSEKGVFYQALTYVQPI
jgi:hypothetical protein